MPALSVSLIYFILRLVLGCLSALLAFLIARLAGNADTDARRAAACRKGPFALNTDVPSTLSRYP